MKKENGWNLEEQVREEIDEYVGVLQFVLMTSVSVQGKVYLPRWCLCLLAKRLKNSLPKEHWDANWLEEQEMKVTSRLEDASRL